MATNPTLTVDVHLGLDDLRDSLRHDAACGLVAAPKELPPKWFYDDRGSELFDRITRLPEYYPTRRERAILVSRSAEIAARTGADTLVELGSGTSEKTRFLLDAMTTSGRLRRFVPFDVSRRPRSGSPGSASQWRQRMRSILGRIQGASPCIRFNNSFCADTPRSRPRGLRLVHCPSAPRSHASQLSDR